MFGNLTIIAWFMGGLGMAGLWIKLCADAEEKERVNPLFQRAVRRWLAPQAGDEAERPNWAESFITLFDRTFGDRFFSLKFLFRSFVATTTICALLVLVWVGFGTITWATLDAFLLKANVSQWQAVQWLIVILLGNLIADYLSLFETRLILGSMRGRTGLAQLFALVADLLLTFLIYFFVASALYAVESLWQYDRPVMDQLRYVLGSELVGGEGNSWANSNTTFFGVFQNVFFDAEGWPGTRLEFGTFYADAYRISFITTFFTSVWIWLFVLTGVLGRIFFVVNGRLTRFGRLFNVNEKPVTAAGYVLALITLVLHISAFAGFHLWQAVGTSGETEFVEETEG